MKHESGHEPTPTGYEPHTSSSSGGGTVPPQGGPLLGGRYRLRERLGFGGMGTVWKAHDEVVDRDVAVKEPRLPDHLTQRQRDTAFSRMRREARVAARIDHPSVVVIHDMVVQDGQPWIVMELVRGRSLADALDEGTLSPQEAARVALPVLGALAAAHDAGVLHRDVKPANVLLGPHGRVVLTDFGVALVEGEKHLTETGVFVGSPEFVAPERVLGQRPGPASDLFSVGVLLYTAVEGWSPFRRGTVPATLQAVISAEPQRPVRAGALIDLIMCCLDKDPLARPSALEAQDALRELADPWRPPRSGARPVARSKPGARAGNAVRRGALARVRALLPRRTLSWIALALVAAVLAAAAVVLLARPFGGTSQLPDDWRRYDERSGVRVSVAVPAEYQRSENQNAVTFTDPAGIYQVEVRRFAGVDDRSALKEANDWLEYYRDGADSPRRAVAGKIAARDFHGEAAAELETTYRDRDGSDIVTVRRSRELVLVDATTKVEWKIAVVTPDGKGYARKGDELFGEVVAQLRVPGL